MSLTAERAGLAYRRHHRLRRTPELRRLVAETRLGPSSLILPIFVDARLDARPSGHTVATSATAPTSRANEVNNAKRANP